MTRISLIDGSPVSVDLGDVPLVGELRWRRNRYGYAVANYTCTSGKRTTVLMHRLIMGTGESRSIDHINGDKLDNRRANLRYATPTQNGMNRPKNISNKSGFKGVSFKADRGRFVAQINVEGIRKTLGTFLSAEEAAAAYDEVAYDLYGVFARLNFDRGSADG